MKTSNNLPSPERSCIGLKFMKIIQIEHSGSSQTAYRATPVQPDTTIDILTAEGEIIERLDLVECVALNNVDRVIQVKSGDVYAGTTGRFFAVLTAVQALKASFSK